MKERKRKQRYLFQSFKDKPDKISVKPEYPREKVSMQVNCWKILKPKQQFTRDLNDKIIHIKKI